MVERSASRISATFKGRTSPTDASGRKARSTWIPESVTVTVESVAVTEQAIRNAQATNVKSPQVGPSANASAHASITANPSMRIHTQAAGQSRSRYVMPVLTRVHVRPGRGFIGREPVDVGLLVERLHPRAVLPTRAHPGDAGFDLRSVESHLLGPGHRVAVGTGLAIALPPGFVGLIHPRSGLALRHGVTVANAPGTIDAGYRGEIRVILVNLGESEWTCEVGDRIAQLLVARVWLPRMTEVSALPGSGRGDSGFGSTGLR